MTHFRLAAILALTPLLHGQAGDDSQTRPPVTKADLQIVKRARAILSTPAKWNRADTRVCPATAKTFSLYCALEKATDEVSGNFEHRGAAMQEARFVIDAIAPHNNYDHRLMGYNNDPARTFADIRKFFDLLEAAIAKRLNDPKADIKPDAPLPAVAPVQETAPAISVADLQILKRAREILDSPSRWNRADNQECPAGAKTFSLFCAFRMAIEQVKGSFDNNEAAIQEARGFITEIDVNRRYSARLMDFNNDTSVTFEDVQKLFRTVEELLVKRLSAH